MYRLQNQLSYNPLPRIDDLIDSVGNTMFVTKIDLLEGYVRTGLCKRTQLVSAFITPFGLNHYLVITVGMRNAPATFQRVVNYLDLKVF